MLKQALLEWYRLTVGDFRKKCYTFTIDSKETMSQFFARFQHYLSQRIALSKINEIIDGWKELKMKEQLLLMCPCELSLFVGDHKLKGKGELLMLVNTFTDVHSFFWKERDS